MDLDEEFYFCYSASLRIHSEEGLDFERIKSNILLEPDHEHKIGDKANPKSKRVYSNDMLMFKSGLKKEDSLNSHLIALWEKLEPYKDFILSLKSDAKVDVFCGYRTDCETGGVDITHKALEIYQELKIGFGLSVIVT